ncbi:MAG: T9SS type A sorting domain-containing protein [Bacteroidota bacterium]
MISLTGCTGVLGNMIPKNTTSCNILYTGVDEANIPNASEINIYPNPTSEFLTLRVTSEKETDLTIIVSDIVGQILKEKKASIGQGNFENKIDVSNLSKGMYICTVISKNKKTTLKFIKQ